MPRPIPLAIAPQSVLSPLSRTDESIIMGKEDLHEVLKAAPNATIIASHMESVNHATLSRRELRAFLEDKGMAARVLIPADGESYRF